MNAIYYEDFSQRVARNYGRLASDTYRNERVFREAEYAWEGDWEGRALLAFVCLKRLTGKEISSLPYEISHLKEKTNRYGYFGAVTDGSAVSEQLLSGNGWFLRGLCEYYQDTKDEGILANIKSIVENLYLRCEGLYDRYPLVERGAEGGVMGELARGADGWTLSTDVGCAFIALDGLSAAYAILKDGALKTFIDKQIDRFLAIDKLQYRVQTHATLTVCRAILRMYLLTDEKHYLARGKELFDYYVHTGMTLTYENFNWFGREDTWTEPCAVIDSLITALYLYRSLGDETYLKLARRIYFNGFNLCQRDNGGAGTNSCVTERAPVWSAQMYEAEFCCSMRTAEGLYRVSLFCEELFGESDEGKEIVHDEHGRYFRGDHMLCSVNGGALRELPKIYEYPQKELSELRLQIVFKEEKA